MEPTNAILMQPFEADHAQKLYEIVFDELDLIGCTTNRADSCRSDISFRLQDRIDDFIKKADICVADLTSPRNHNVLLEVGAALALQIPVIIIANETLPANIRGNIYVNLDPADLSKEEGRVAFKEVLRQRIAEAKNQIGKLPTENFIAHGYPDRGGVDFDLIIRRTERRINILTTNLGYVVNEKLISEVNPQGRTILEALIEELPKKKNQGFQTRILALDPDSNFTNDRADSLHRDRSEFRDSVRQNLDILTNKIQKISTGNVEVKIYDEYPLQMTFFFDDIIVNSVVASSRSSRYCVTYVHYLTYRSAKDSFERHFDELWGRSRQYIVRQNILEINRIQQ
jgi:hypothetical protein